MSENTEKLIKLIKDNDNINAKKQLMKILRQKVSEKINHVLDR